MQHGQGHEVPNHERRDKQNLNGSYRYGKINNSGNGNTISQSILPTNTFTTTENSNFFSSKQRHSANAIYEYQLDSSTSLKVVTSGYKGNQSSLNNYKSSSINSLGNPINNSNRVTSVQGDDQSFSGNILLRKRFKKPGRTASLSFDQQYKQNNTSGFLNALNQFYDKSGQLVNTDSIDQNKINEITNSGNYTKLAFTEPVLKNVFVELSYGRRVSNSESQKLSYDKSANNKYENLNEDFSNHYNFKVLTNSGGMTWRYNTKKITFSAGGDVARANFKQTNLFNNTVVKYNYTNLFPRSRFQYKFNSNSRIGIGYNGVTRPPGIEQIQPVRDNSNT